MLLVKFLRLDTVTNLLPYNIIFEGWSFRVIQQILLSKLCDLFTSFKIIPYLIARLNILTLYIYIYIVSLR